MQRQKKEQMELVAKEKEALKKKEKDLKSAENKEKEEIKTAENLIKEGSERLNQAISKKDFNEAQVASALIDGAPKKCQVQGKTWMKSSKIEDALMKQNLK